MKTFFDLKTEWLDLFLVRHVPADYQIKNKHVLESDFGECVGIDFESEKKTGYIYFWSTGMLGFGLLEIPSCSVIINHEFFELDDEDAMKFVQRLIENL
jgi:hypothetical protein